MKKLAVFAVGTSTGAVLATVGIALAIKEELPTIVSKKVENGVVRTHRFLVRKLFGEDAAESSATMNYYRRQTVTGRI